jgi:hypothetical protein
MKKYFTLFLLPVFLTACIGTSRFNHIVYQKYTNLPKINEQNNNDFISIQTEELDNLDDLLVKTKKLKFFFIPALVY